MFNKPRVYKSEFLAIPLNYGGTSCGEGGYCFKAAFLKASSFARGGSKGLISRLFWTFLGFSGYRMNAKDEEICFDAGGYHSTEIQKKWRQKYQALRTLLHEFEVRLRMIDSEEGYWRSRLIDQPPTPAESRKLKLEFLRRAQRAGLIEVKP